jgi:hypothetical protein
MITKYRNKALLRLALGFGLLIFGVVIAGVTSHTSAGQLGGCLGVISALIGYMIYVYGCADLLKSKGYDSNMMPAFIIPALCCSAAFIFLAPVIILFGLEDRTTRR